jgi:hypothetical protein
MGMLLESEYPAVEYSRGRTLCEGREAWLRFHKARSYVACHQVYNFRSL